MITLENDQLVFRFPEVHHAAICEIEFQRTLRIPDDGKTYPLPAGLGSFPLRHIDDFANRLPETLTTRGGVVMPMWQAEAMWLSFSTHGFHGYPFAIKVATGKINALTGEAWRPGLHRDPQDYLVLPDQPWLDGYCVEKGTIRQFVAAPPGSGLTAEEQITGRADHGGLQLLVYPMKKSAYERLYPPTPPGVRSAYDMPDPQMGLAPGGKMRQEIYEDPHPFDVWDLRNSARCFVTILDVLSWNRVTGEPPATQPITAQRYAVARIPWFDYYAADQTALAGSGTLSGLKSLGGGNEAGLVGHAGGPGSPHPVVALGPGPRPVGAPHQVREAEW